MADNEHPPPPAPRDEPGSFEPAAGPIEPAAGQVEPTAGPIEPPAAQPALRAPTEPAPIDPEQVRQFQQFQQFQELLRQQAEQGTTPPNTSPALGQLQPWGPPPKRRSWIGRFMSKVVIAVVTIVLLIVAGFYAIAYLLTPDREQLPASQTGGGKTEDNLVLETNPYEAVRKIYHHIANGENGVPEQVCLRFDDRGAKFASDLGYPDCEQAVRGLAQQVTDSNAYAESMPSYTTTTVPGDEIVISSCADNVRGGIEGGPSLGEFTVAKIPGSTKGQWIITDHENEPSCELVPSTPPTS